MKILVVVFWVLMPCADVVGYKSFGGSCCLSFQGEVNVGILQRHHRCHNPEDHD
jgi:hypothetical protein